MDAPITATNWLTHPQIVEIRRLDGAIGRELRGTAPTDGAECEDGFGEKRVWEVRSGARVRLDTGTDDHRVTVTGTYDARRRLRFVFVRAGAVNGTSVEYRVYFDAEGRRLWRNFSQVGPGYGFTPEAFEKTLGPDFARLADAGC